MQQQGKPLTKTGPVTDDETFEDVSVASIYDGDTFTINLNCSLAVYCEKVPVRVRGVDTPEVKGKTEREKKLAQKAKAFTQDFLSVRPISLSNCGRDKYFRLLCDVQNGDGKDLAKELIKRDYGYSYQGGTKSKKYQ
jgi:endonuclease YncB( thermonuclease family)